MIEPFEGKTPKLAPGVFVAPGAVVIGDVEIGADSSSWFNSVVRGDVYYVRIGERCNIQDLSMVHVTRGRHETVLGDDITVGHRVVLHGCHVADHSLVGMGTIVMDRAIIGEYCIIGAGSLVTEGTVIPPGTLAVGSPARVRRELTDAERSFLEQSSHKYQRLAARYRNLPGASFSM